MSGDCVGMYVAEGCSSRGVIVGIDELMWGWGWSREREREWDGGLGVLTERVDFNRWVRREIYCCML